MKITVAELIRRKIEIWKVRDVPIFQGGAIMNVLSEISKSKKIKYYCPNHEQVLAMVDAYARIKVWRRISYKWSWSHKSYNWDSVFFL